MSRRPRYDCPGASHYVITRSGHGLKLFNTPEEARTYLSLVADILSEHEIDLLAYALLPSEFHLLLQPPTGNATALVMPMKRISQRYSRYWSRLHHSRGHLFSGRFASIVVDTERYLGSIVAHIHRLPLETGLAEALESYPWTSHAAYLGGPSETPLRTERFSDWRALLSGETTYEALVGQEDPAFEEMLVRARKSGTLGDETFMRRIQENSSEDVEVPRQSIQVTFNDVIETVTGMFGVNEGDLIGRARNDRTSVPRELLVYVAVNDLKKPVGHVARYLRRDQGLISRIIRKLKARPEWRTEVERVRRHLARSRA
jgi:REP element-mobilizing transposase RayT